MHRIRTWARTKAHGPSPLTSTPSRTNSRATVQRTASGSVRSVNGANAAHDHHPSINQDDSQEPVKINVLVRFFLASKDILFYSVINVLLVFVPVGMAVHFSSMPAGVVFAMNAIAIVPLAGLLSHATESVASRTGDTAGALMNVTFGNAVELIIFIIALVKNEIRIVQASLVGSILANLLLILGMSFFLGGLRFREQIYNSTVTQMSACLLSLSVTSLLLPTAFHASFSNTETANHKVLRVSRGTSIVLLLVYLLYLVFQLRSHSYMYESTPQDVIERESVPGPAAQYFHASPSSSSVSSSFGSDTDGSIHSEHATTARIRRIIKRGKRSRQTSVASPKNQGARSPLGESRMATPDPEDNFLRRIALVDTPVAMTPITTPGTTTAEDPMDKLGERSKVSPRKHKRHRRSYKVNTSRRASCAEKGESAPADGLLNGRRVDFALSSNMEAQTSSPRPRPFSLRSLRPVTNVFTASPINPVAVAAAGTSDSNEHHRHIQRARTLPAGRNTLLPRTAPPIIPISVGSRARTGPISNTAGREDTPRINLDTATATQEGELEEPKPQTSMTTAILLLLTSTALVAVCAEFMVDSIDSIVTNQSGISEAFIGLILLPIVGNAAEHVTAVSVALKNKMDLSIGVALGSSIQISLFITPLVVIIGWIMDKDMSLFFTLFETICMFVSAFIVNFLVLDGRSNYLEGALLCSAYVIISVAAFFSPNPRAASQLGGGGNGGLPPGS